MRMRCMAHRKIGQRISAVCAQTNVCLFMGRNASAAMTAPP